MDGFDSNTDNNASVPSTPIVVSYPGATPDAELLEWISIGRVAGVILFADNAPSDDAVRESVAQMREVAGSHPFTVMIDEEGGDVRRLPEAPASMQSLRSYSGAGPEAVAAAYRETARRLRGLGVDTLLAPVVDIGGGRATWLGERTYSDDPHQVARMVRAVLPILEGEGVRGCVKHFPGTRAVAQDTHTGVGIDETAPSDWERTDAVPFREAITAGTPLVMVGHHKLLGFDSVRPSCLSPLIVQVLLRERLGFNGHVVTDDLGMKAIAGAYSIEVAVNAALDAGCTLLLVCHDRTMQRRALIACEERARRGAGARTA